MLVFHLVAGGLDRSLKHVFMWMKFGTKKNGTKEKQLCSQSSTYTDSESPLETKVIGKIFLCVCVCVCMRECVCECAQATEWHILCMI